MLEDFIEYFELNSHPAVIKGESLSFNGKTVPIRDGIPRFTPDISYSSGNFSLLREKHSNLQLDSQNKTKDRYNTILTRTSWPKEFFQNKTVLECGCGAGPDTEVLLSLGAKVLAADLAGSTIARNNLKDQKNLCLIQASIMDLPLKRKSFDIVFCHRVIQHTPDPIQTLRHILQFVKPSGAIFVHSYARTAFQMWNWKYALRPITKRMNPESLYRFIEWYAPCTYRISNFLMRSSIGKKINHVFIPFRNYRSSSKFQNMSDKQIIEYGVHDTFDALSPRYDSPLKADEMRDIASENISTPFEIYEHKNITLLRSVLN